MALLLYSSRILTHITPIKIKRKIRKTLVPNVYIVDKEEFRGEEKEG
jgi:hypothetical protein